MAHQHQKRDMGDLIHRANTPQKTSPASYERYTVAWICALPKEMFAAQAVLDEVHESLPRRKNDSNSYVLGSIGCHNIVIACLPTNEYGTNNAVNVLTNLTRTFESIHFGLMVGIGGGVPRENFDIRLGDIIVGTRVVQHDLGKIVGSGHMQHTAVPRTLAHMLGKPLSLLQAEHQPHSSRIPLILEEKFRDHPAYAYPTTADRLFASEYPHNSEESSCDECNPSFLLQRAERLTTNPYIHYGTIASGNQVMKNSEIRDMVAQAVDAICFEMEAAGLNDICPCLSIRGVCDYSDSHKSKEWQEYAAATAASFAREFLEKLPQTDENFTSNPENEYWLQNEKYNQCLRDLRETDPRDDKTRIQETKGGLLEDAYRWILENDQFQEWHKASRSQLLWIKGDPGKGKTMLLCGLINELEKEHGSLLSYFFCQATEAQLSNATAVLRGLIYLLVVQRPPLFSYIEERYDHAGKQLFEDGNAWQALSKIFMAMLEDPLLNGALLIVDALDECSTDLEDLLGLIIKSSSVKWIVTSRNWLEIERFLDRSEQKVRLHLELNQESVSTAVEAFIEYKVAQLAEQKRYDAELKSHVKSYLSDNADGTFLWVALVCQQLADRKVFRKRHTRLSLELFPRGLDSLYGRMMEYISSSHDAQICKEILALSSVVYRPITLTELKTLLGSQYEDDDDDLPDIVASCGSFLTLRGDAIYFLHQSAKDFLLKKASDQILPSGFAYQHELVFKRSLQALSKILRRDICQLDHPGFSIYDISPGVLKPLDTIRYSCVYWVDHLRDSEPTGLSNILKDGGDVHVFIQKKYLYWLESLGLLRSIGQGVEAISTLEGLAIKLKTQELVTKLLQDARRFILTHKRSIEIAPLQAYASALIFSPEGTLIRDLFKHEEPDWIDLKPKMNKNWSNCLQTLESHDDPITEIALSTDNQLIASAGGNMIVKIWEITTGLCRHTLEFHAYEPTFITFLPDERFLVASSYTITIWNTKTGFCLRTLEVSDESLDSLASSPDGQYLALKYYGSTIRIWSLKTGKCLKSLGEESGRVYSIVFSPDSQRLMLGSVDNTVRIWDMKAFTCLQTLHIHDAEVVSGAFSPDGKRLALISNDNTIKIWNAAAGSSLPILKIPKHIWVIVAFSADGKRLAVHDETPEIKLFDVETGTILQTLKGAGTNLLSMAFTADGQHIISGTHDGLIKVWAISIDMCPQTVEAHEEAPNSIVISADGLRVASGSPDASVKIWDTNTGTCLQTLESHSKKINCVAFSPDNTLLLSGSNDWTINVWDAISGTCLHTLEHDGEVSSVTFILDGRHILSAVRQKAPKVWDIATGRCLQTLEHNASPFSMAFSADRRYGASNLGDAGVMIRGKGQHHSKTLRTRAPSRSLAFSVDSQYLAESSETGEVTIWDIEKCVCLHRIYVGRALGRLSFDLWTNSQLHTDIGILDLDVPNPTPDINAESLGIPALPSSDSSTHRIRIDGEWITKRGKNVLWLPPEYRPKESDVFKSTIAVGCESGRVLIMRFS